MSSPSPSGAGRTARLAGSTGVAVLVVAIVVMMIVPLPTWLLDVLITVNLAASVTVLLGAVYARDALAIASFPTLLVLTTLYRLALNVSTVRLILVQADAGQVVRAFGSFVVRGDYVAGAAVFLILTLVQYLVIARGAERVAEVAARFTLDAMPGKQLAIDADLRSGAIDAEEARRRRRSLGREAQVYGALDGAMRFVKGDAIAGILILVISIVGGLLTGLLRQQLPLGDAARLYTLLTIGDGLVSQMPALLIATAAGLVVTRVSEDDAGDGESRVGAELVEQLLGRPRTLAAVALLLVALAVVGLPIVPMLVVAAPFALGAIAVYRRGTPPPPPAPLEPQAPLPVALALDPALARAVPDVDATLTAAARALVEDLGVPLPPVAVAVDPSLPPRGYEVRLRGVPLADGVVPDGKLLAEATPSRLATLAVEGQATTHPGSGLPAAWVAASTAPTLEKAGIGLRDARACLASALDGTLRRHVAELLGFDETQRLLDGLARSHPALVRETVPLRVDVATLTEVLRRLVSEGVPIGDLRDVLEALASSPPEPGHERDAALLSERVRVALRRHLTHRLARNKQVSAVMLDPMIEEAVREAIRAGRGGQVLALEPAIANDILAALDRALATVEAARPVVVTSAELRRHVRRLFAAEHPELPVITWQELNPDVQVEPVARVAL